MTRPTVDETRSDDAPLNSGRRLVILLMAGAAVSKALGLGREILMAHALGASMVADAFRLALTGVSMPVAIFLNESVPAVLIPLHRHWRENDQVARPFAALVVALGTIATLLAALVILFASQWTEALAGGFSPEAKAKAVEFVRIMALGMPATVIVSVLSAGEISVGRARLTTIRAGLLNVTVIIGLLLLMAFHWANSIAWAFSAAFDILAVWGLATLIREGALDFRSIDVRDVVDAARTFFVRIRTLLILPLVEQGNIWIERLLASRHASGTIASLDYARTITETAVLFISQPIGLMLLSRAASEDDGKTVEAAMRPMFAIGLPSCVVLALFSTDIVRTVFARGAFDEVAVRLTSDAISGISVGLWATTIGWVVLRILNRAGRNAAAVLVLIAAYLANLVFNVAVFSLSPDSTSGPLILGLGESLRGIVMFGATATLLGVAGVAMRMLLLAAVPSVSVLVLGLAVHEYVASFWWRVAAAAGLWTAGVAVGLFILVPNLTGTGRKVLSDLGGRFGRRGASGDR